MVAPPPDNIGRSGTQKRRTIFSDVRDQHTWEHDGFVLIDLFDEGEHALLVQAARELVTPPPRGFVPTMFSVDDGYRARVDSALRRVLGPALARVVPGFRIGFASFAVKAAKSPESAMPLHQDWSFVDEDRSVSLGFWAPLQDVDERNGCMVFVPGSHAVSAGIRGAGVLFPYRDVVPLLTRDDLFFAQMRPGQALVWDHRVWHASPPNLSDVMRVAAAAVLVEGQSPMRFHEPLGKDSVRIHEVEDAWFLRNRPGQPPRGEGLGERAVERPPADAQLILSHLRARRPS